MDKHDLIQKLIDLSIDLGKTPSREEFCKHVINGRNHVEIAFGNYTAFVLAAGLVPKSKKIDSSIFNVPIDRHIEEYVPRETIDHGPYPTIAIISDIHWPFEHKKVLEKFYTYIKENNPEWIILNGDAWDLYSHSRFPKSHNIFTPREEEKMARERNVEFWKNVKSLCPSAKCVQMLGNHDIRPLRRVLEVYPEAEDWIKEKIESLFTFDGVKTIHDPREELKIDNILIFHGYRSKLGDHRDYTLCNTINGHTHKGGVVYRQIRNEVLWELNSGLSGDPEAKGLTYTPQRITNWTLGFGVVNKYGPQFIHL